MSTNKKLIIIAAILISIGLVFHLNRSAFHEPFLAEEEQIADARFEAECPNYSHDRFDFNSGAVIPYECGMTIRGDTVHPGFMAMYNGSWLSLLAGVVIGLVTVIRKIVATVKQKRQKK